MFEEEIKQAAENRIPPPDHEAQLAKELKNIQDHNATLREEIAKQDHELATLSPELKALQNTLKQLEELEATMKAAFTTSKADSKTLKQELATWGNTMTQMITLAAEEEEEEEEENMAQQETTPLTPQEKLIAKVADALGISAPASPRKSPVRLFQEADETKHNGEQGEKAPEGNNGYNA